MSDGKWSVSYCNQGASLVKIEHCILLIKDLQEQKKTIQRQRSVASCSPWACLTHVCTRPRCIPPATRAHSTHHTETLLHQLLNNYFSLSCLIRNKRHQLKMVRANYLRCVQALRRITLNIWFDHQHKKTMARVCGLNAWMIKWGRVLDAPRMHFNYMLLSWIDLFCLL